ncbi:MAG: SUMF1/EgtB/PvdO family nonheme iron enzyme, partial [Planctomycetes bacterium]|nr:SUMF1/EgtB/PvdO family nonheme iron enzyme [Planctomycetota bacterium]
GDNSVITRYAVLVDRSKPTLTTTLYGESSVIGGSMDVGRFPPIVIRVRDEGRIDEKDADVTIDKLEGDVDLLPSTEVVDGGIDLKITAPEGKEMAPGKWRIAYRTRDFAGRESDAVEVIIQVQPPSLYVARAGGLAAKSKTPRQFDDRVVPIKGDTIDLVVRNVAGNGRFLLGFKPEGAEEIRTPGVAVEDAKAAGVRIPNLEGESGSVALHWYQVIGDDVTTVPPVWFDTVRWERDRDPPTWQVIHNGLAVKESNAALANNGLLVTRLSNIKLRVKDDCGFPNDQEELLSKIIGKLPANDFEQRAGQVTWVFHDVPNWTERVIQFDVKDLAGRVTAIALRLIPAEAEPQLNRVTAEAGCNQRDDIWVARSREVTLGLSNRVPQVVGLKVGVTGPDYTHTVTVDEAPEAFEIKLSLPADGEYVVKLTAARADTGMDDEPFAETRIRVDTSPPTVVIKYGSEPVDDYGKVEVERIEGFTAHVDDAHGVDHVDVSLESGAPVFKRLPASRPNVYSIGNPTRDPGAYQLIVRALDIAGNKMTRQIIITLKAKRPVVMPAKTLSVAQIQTLTGMRAVPIVREGKKQFYLAETEATVGQFRAFRNRVSSDLAARIQNFRSKIPELENVSAVAADRIDRTRMEAVWSRNEKASDYMPLRHVYYDVAAFFAFECGGGRLPTAEEWKGAAGLFIKPDAKWVVFMDGSDPKSATRYFRLPKSREWCNFDNKDGARVAGEMSAQNPFGLRGLAGNVAEWIAENGTMGGSYRHNGNNSTTGGGLLERRPHPEARDLESLPDIGLRVLWSEPEGGR